MDLQGLASPEERLGFVRGRLQAGVVIKLFCDFTEPPKYKRLLVAAANCARPLLFVINTEPTDFAKSKQELIAQHLLIKESAENFLDHDSYLDCSNAYDNFDKAEIEKALVNDTTLILGDLSADSAARVLDIITDDPPALSPVHVNAISDGLSRLF